MHEVGLLVKPRLADNSVEGAWDRNILDVYQLYEDESAVTFVQPLVRHNIN